MNQEFTTDYTKCIHCRKCQKQCAFLTKYGIDIGDIERLTELAYHCFLCGKCTEVCPVGIDGRKLVLELRSENVTAEGADTVKAEYKGLTKEKCDYIYRNYRHAGSGAAYFPGCNFPSMYPKTNAKLTKAFAAKGISTIYDCCGKPIFELGLTEDEGRIIEGIESRLRQAAISEIITACPNCYNFLKDRLQIKVTSIYDVLDEFGFAEHIKSDIQLYVPCPDRAAKEWCNKISEYIDGEVTEIDKPQCCGLGGSAAKYESDLAKGFAEDLKSGVQGSDARTMLYCASCAGNFKRNGVNNVDHILTELLGTGEKPDTLKSYINRMLTKVK